MDFSQKCYELLKQIPKGKVSTYKEIAKALNTKAYRAVGSAMRKNPNPVSVPCHRVVKSDGSIGGYVFGAFEKKVLLEKEGIRIKDAKVVDFKTVLYRFTDADKNILRSKLITEQ